MSKTKRDVIEIDKNKFKDGKIGTWDMESIREINSFDRYISFLMEQVLDSITQNDEERDYRSYYSRYHDKSSLLYNLARLRLIESEHQQLHITQKETENDLLLCNRRVSFLEDKLAGKKKGNSMTKADMADRISKLEIWYKKAKECSELYKSKYHELLRFKTNVLEAGTSHFNRGDY